MQIDASTADFEQRAVLLFSLIVFELDPTHFVLSDVVIGSGRYTMVSWREEPKAEFEHLLSQGLFDQIEGSPGAYRISVKGLVFLDERMDEFC